MPYSVQLLWSNNAQTTVAGSISNLSTTVNLASGTGALFPSPGPGQGFTGTFTDAATGLLHEIVLVTGRTGDTLTIVRGQEGTTPLNWTANDLFANLWTSGAAASLVQAYQLQFQTGNYAVDTGSANSYIVALDPVVSSAPAAGFIVRVRISNTNTGASTLNAGWGAAVIARRYGTNLIGNELPANRIAELIWNGGQWQLLSIYPATAAAITAGTDTQSAVTPAQLAAAVGNQRLLTGQCYLRYVSSTQIRLIPYNGNVVPVNGNMIAVAGTGVNVANTNITLNGAGGSDLANNANYLVAFNESGQLEFWTLGTGHATSTSAGNVGVEIIAGHNDKTLVGMVRTNGSGQFVDTDGSLFTLSWFNRRPKKTTTTFTGNPTYSSGTVGELDSSIRNGFIVWNDDKPRYSNTGSVQCGSSGQLAMTSIGFDGTTPELQAAIFSGMHTSTEGSSTIGMTNFDGMKSGLSEGYHYATLLAAATIGVGLWQGGSTVISGSAIPPNALTVMVMG